MCLKDSDAARTISGQLLGELLADDGVGLLLERLGALGDRFRLGQAARADRGAFGLALGLGRLTVGDAARRS